MVDIPPDILEVLKCSICEMYLSWGPAYLQHDGAAVCGRCYTPKHPATRNTQCEAMAKLLKFPCKYRDFGCLETVPYASEREEIAHEDVCEYRQYVCPVLGTSFCAWMGTREAMLAHCRDKHPDRVLDNPCTFTHDFCRTSLRSYIITAYQQLFLLHVKICTITGNIFHAIRFLGGSVEASDFLFNLYIESKGTSLLKVGHVAPQGCLEIMVDISLALNINCVLNFMDGFDGTKFTVTVTRKLTEVKRDTNKAVINMKKKELKPKSSSGSGIEDGATSAKKGRDRLKGSREEEGEIIFSRHWPRLWQTDKKRILEVRC